MKDWERILVKPLIGWFTILVVALAAAVLILQQGGIIKIGFLESGAFRPTREFPQARPELSCPPPTVIAPPGGGEVPSKPISPEEPLARPNILVIMTDDQDSKSLSVMDRVKSLVFEKGTAFSNYFISYSICCPSRATFLTGQYAHNNGVLGNSPPTGGYGALDHTNTLPVWLQNGGYRTAHIGKYLNGYGSTPTADSTKNGEYVPPDFKTLRSVTPPPSATVVPPGYTEWYGLIDPFTYAYYNYIINENGTLKQYGNDPTDYQTDVLTKKAVDFINKSTSDTKPFFLVVAYVAPHAGLPPPASEPEPAPRHKNSLKDCTLPKPPSFNEKVISDKPSMYQLKLLTPAEIKEVESSYCSRLKSLLAIDEGVDKIIQSLQNSGKLENTIIIFTSDNGFMNGEHRVPAGKGLTYEESIKVPLAIRGPGIAMNQTIPKIVGNIDLAPTIVELSGASPGRIMDGRSLMPLLNDPNISWRNDYLIESLQFVLYSGIRSEKYLYAEHKKAADKGEIEKELYNFQDDSCHKADPYELENQQQNKCYSQTIKGLSQRLKALMTCSGASCY